MMGIVLLRDMIFVNYMCEEKMLDTDIFRSTYAQKKEPPFDDSSYKF